jgi:hypothetical protein
MDREHYLYLGKRLSLSLGLVALGAAMAWAISLMLLQSAAIQAGALPAPGTRLTDAGLVKQNPLWIAARTLQSLADGVGVVGAVLVLVYGVVDRYEDEVMAVIE